MDEGFRTEQLALDWTGAQDSATVANYAEGGFMIEVLIEITANGAFPQEKRRRSLRWSPEGLEKAAESGV
jgi:hypothetical protein